MKMKVILVDDELLALKRMELLLKERKEFEIIGKFTNGYEALSEINKQSPDLLFLDINLNNSVSAFDLIKEFKCTPLLVFVTAYDEHAIKAFEYYALDFLLKPYKDERFYISLDRALEPRNLEMREGYYKRISEFLELQSKPKPIKKISIRIGNKIQLISAEKINYIKASGYYAEIFTSDKKHVKRESIRNLIDQLKNGPFIRIHRSTIINLNFIDQLVYSNYGELDVKMTDSSSFRVSKRYKKELLDKIGI